jgi:hypothetical protein
MNSVKISICQDTAEYKSIGSKVTIRIILEVAVVKRI